jgi:ATP-binding cassette subfamily C (CFTR/MRP) protein 1
LILWVTKPGQQTPVSVTAAALSFIVTLALVALSSMEHTRSVRPSFIINTHLFFSTLLDLAQARTLWLLPEDGNLATVFTVCIAFNVVLLILESIEKKSFLKSPYRNYPPEVLGGIFNRSVFWWLNSLFLNGYRRVLNLDDLFETDEEPSSRKLQQRMRSTWEQSKKDNKHLLFLATLSCFKLPLFKMIFPRLCMSALKLSQPLLINRAVSLISQPQDPSSRNFGYGLIGATALIYFGLAIANAKCKHKIYKAVTMVRGGLISLISDTTLLLDADSVRESAAVTLMSTGIDRIVAGVENLDFIWASPIEIAVALYLLDRELGLSCLVPLGICLGKFLQGYWTAPLLTLL